MEIGDVGHLRAADAELADLAGVDEKVDGRIGVSATAKASPRSRRMAEIHGNGNGLRMCRSRLLALMSGRDGAAGRNRADGLTLRRASTYPRLVPVAPSVRMSSNEERP